METNLYTFDELQALIKKEQRKYYVAIETEQDFVTAMELHLKIKALKKAVDGRLKNELRE